MLIMPTSNIISALLDRLVTHGGTKGQDRRAGHDSKDDKDGNYGSGDTSKLKNFS